MPQIFETPEVLPWRFVGLLYGGGGVGKTQLATSCVATPQLREIFGDRIILAAFDQGSDPLLSVRPAYRKHIITVKPELQTHPTTKMQFYNPYKEGAAVCRFNWKERYPDVKTFIFDGFSGWSDDLLRQVANQGVIQSGDKGDRHLSFGEDADGTKIQQPIIGDYGFAQNMMMQTLKLMFRCQRDLNIIVICNEGWWKPDGGSLDTMVGGPDTIGGKSIGRLTKEFDNVFRVMTVTSDVNQGGKLVRTTKRQVLTEKRGVWEAKIRHGAGANPMPEVTLDVDTGPFWQKLVDATRVAA